MSVIKQNVADGGTNTTAVTTGNSGGGSGDAWSSISGGAGVWTFSNTQVVKGPLAYRIVQGVGVGAALDWDFAAPLTTHYGRLYLYLTSFAASSHPIFKGLGAAFANAWRVDLTATGQVRVRDSAQAILTTTSQTITTGAWWRFEWKVVNGTGTNGQVVFNVYSGDATSPSFSYSNLACDTGATTEHLQVGPSLSSPQLATAYYDEIVTDTAAFPGPANITNQSPTGNAGSDQSVIEGQTVTLDGTASSDTDGTIASYAWAQTGGTAVTLSSASVAQPTFTAPTAPATLVFQLTATDNQSATGTDTVTITVGSGLLRFNTAQGGNNATVVTTGNSGGGSGDAFNALTNANNEWTFSNTASARGALAYKCVQVASTSTNMQWNLSALTEHYGRAYFYFTGLPSNTQVLIKGLITGFASDAWRIDITSTGQIRTRDAAGTVLATSSQTMLTSAFYRIEWHIISGSGTAGTFELKLFSADATSPLYSYSNDACNTGTETSYVQFGPSLGSGGLLPTFYLDELAVNPTGWIGAAQGAGINALPVASAGPDAAAVQGSVAVLDGSGSNDADGTISTYTWAQTSGTSVTLSSSAVAQPSFTAPAGPAVLTFQLTVTDNMGSTATDSVTITVNTSLLRLNTAEGGSDGTLATTGNTGGVSGNAWSAISGGGTEWTFSDTVSARGSLAYRCSQATLSTALSWDIGALTQIYGRAYFYFTGFATGTQILAKGLNAGFASTVWRIDVSSTGQVRVRDAASTSLATSTATMAPGVFYRVEWHIISGTGTTGTFEVRVYTADQVSPLYSYSNTTCNTGAETSHVQFGPSLPTPTFPVVFIDEPAVDTQGWIGTASGTLLNSPPTANAGPDQNVSVNASVSLNGSGSSDLDGTISTYSWEQISGTAVTLSSNTVAQPTFTAPASATSLVFRLAVTDNQGAIGMDTVQVTVLAATIFQNTAEGGTAGIAATTGNSGGGSGNAFTAVTGGTNTWTYASSHTARGSLAYQCDQVNGSGAALQWTLSAITEIYGRMYFYFAGFPSSSRPVVKGFSTGFANAWRIDINASGKLLVRDSGNTVRFTGTANVLAGLWYRLEWHIVSSTTVGRIEARLYVGDQLTTFDSFSSAASLNIGPETSAIQFGPAISINPAAPRNWYDELAIGSAAGSWIGIAPGTPLNQAPTANAGSDTTVEPNATCTLLGSAADDGNIATWTWRQISGPSVTLSSLSAQNPTFTSPSVTGGTTLTFGLTVIDDGGLSSSEDTVTVTVLTPTLFYAQSGSWNPVQ